MIIHAILILFLYAYFCITGIDLLLDNKLWKIYCSICAHAYEMKHNIKKKHFIAFKTYENRLLF